MMGTSAVYKESIKIVDGAFWRPLKRPLKGLKGPLKVLMGLLGWQSNSESTINLMLKPAQSMTQARGDHSWPYEGLKKTL
jgi:hypothetical protein